MTETSVHAFCRLALNQARWECRELGIDVPKKMTALSCGNGQYFVQGVDDAGEYVDGDCKIDARVQRIRRFLDK